MTIKSYDGPPLKVWDGSRKKPCAACSFCGMDMDMDPYCGHKEAGGYGIALHLPNGPRSQKGFCGPEGKFFEQHPKRGPDGSLGQPHEEDCPDPEEKNGAHVTCPESTEPTHLEHIMSHLVERFTGELGEERHDIHELTNVVVVDPDIGNWQFTQQDIHVLRYALEIALEDEWKCTVCGDEAGPNICQSCE